MDTAVPPIIVSYVYNCQTIRHVNPLQAYTDEYIYNTIEYIFIQFIYIIYYYFNLLNEYRIKDQVKNLSEGINT